MYIYICIHIRYMQIYIPPEPGTQKNQGTSSSTIKGRFFQSMSKTQGIDINGDLYPGNWSRGDCCKRTGGPCRWLTEASPWGTNGGAIKGQQNAVGDPTHTDPIKDSLICIHNLDDQNLYHSIIQQRACDFLRFLSESLFRTVQRSKDGEIKMRRLDIMSCHQNHPNWYHMEKPRFSIITWFWLHHVCKHRIFRKLLEKVRYPERGVHIYLHIYIYTICDHNFLLL